LVSKSIGLAARGWQSQLSLNLDDDIIAQLSAQKLSIVFLSGKRTAPELCKSSSIDKFHSTFKNSPFFIYSTVTMSVLRKLSPSEEPRIQYARFEEKKKNPHPKFTEKIVHDHKTGKPVLDSDGNPVKTLEILDEYETKRIITIAYRLYLDRKAMNVEYAGSVFKNDDAFPVKKSTFLEDSDDEEEADMEIYVETPDGDVVTLHMKNDDKLLHLKQKLEKLTHIPLREQNIYYYGEHLTHNHDTMKDFEIEDEETLYHVTKKHPKETFVRRKHASTARGRLEKRPIFVTFPMEERYRENLLLRPFFNREKRDGETDAQWKERTLKERLDWEKTDEFKNWRSVRDEFEAVFQKFLRRHVAEHGVFSEKRQKQSDLERSRHHAATSGKTHSKNGQSSEYELPSGKVVQTMMKEFVVKRGNRYDLVDVSDSAMKRMLKTLEHAGKSSKHDSGDDDYDYEEEDDKSHISLPHHSKSGKH
jgi:hypothetical protein